MSSIFGCKVMLHCRFMIIKLGAKLKVIHWNIFLEMICSRDAPQKLGHAWLCLTVFAKHVRCAGIFLNHTIPDVWPPNLSAICPCTCKGNGWAGWTKQVGEKKHPKVNINQLQYSGRSYKWLCRNDWAGILGYNHFSFVLDLDRLSR